MDLHMPDMDGLSAWERIRRRSRRDGRTRWPRIVALTADGRPGQSDRLRAHGFHGVLHKPVSIETLVEALSAVAADETSFVEPADAGSEPAALVDHSQAERAAGGVEQANELQQALARELADHVDAIDQLIANGRHAEAADRLHQWSGAAGYAGARRFSEASARLERCLRSGVNSSPGSLYFEWRRTLAGTLAALEQRPD
jgi:CheY-like chemotaxis protein